MLFKLSFVGMTGSGKRVHLCNREHCHFHLAAHRNGCRLVKEILLSPTAKMPPSQTELEHVKQLSMLLHLA